MPGRVLVTGISGTIGGHVALALLYAGYTVRGSVRDPARVDEVRANLGRAGADIRRLEIVELDLLDDRGWEAAAHGCRFLQHIASPLSVRPPKDPDILIRPAVEGTRRAVGAALAAGVERIVVTSSVAAITAGHRMGRTERFSGSDWSLTEGEGVYAYSEAKTRAELEAWSLVEEAGRREILATLHPSFVLGPLLGVDQGGSSLIVSHLLNGFAPLAPRFKLDIVDVRDVAALHVRAMEAPMAGGARYLASAGAIMLPDLIESLRGAYPELSGRLPRLPAPDWLFRLYGAFNRDFRANLDGMNPAWPGYDATPAERLLGRPFISPRLAALATAQSLLDFGIVRRPGATKKH
jgi:dihydroflavonol-4-reductase